jgi:autotransporter-associated beta strand protein
LAVLLLGHPVGAATSGAWKIAATSGNWNTAGNWLANNIANGVGVVGDFTNTIASPGPTITIDTAVILGTLNLGTKNPTKVFPFRIVNNAATGSLTFNNGGSGAVITETNLSPGDTISCNFILSDNLLITNFTTSRFTIASNITESGEARSITVYASGGTLVLGGDNTYSGATILNGGINLVTGSLGTTVVTVNTNATLGGTGTINGAVTVQSGGILAPGAGGIGSLTFNNSLSLAGATIMEINRTGNLADKIYMNGGTVTLGGVLTIVNLGNALQNGDRFTLIQGTMSGSFSSVTPATPGADLQWDMTHLTAGGDGTIRVISAGNQAPVAVNDTYNVNQNALLNVAAPGVLGNDTDANGDALTAVLVSGPSHGSLTLKADGSFAYTPATNYIGTDGFTYLDSDGTDSSAVATVTLSVLRNTSWAGLACAKPNVIFILADDMGFGDVGFNGNTMIHTPVLDSLAAQGMRFTKAYAGSPVCAPSRCGLLTGKDSAHSAIRANFEEAPLGPQQFQLPLPSGSFTLGHLFKQGGYATACIGKWGLGGPDSPGAPWLMGFDYYFGYLSQKEAWWYYPTNLYRNNTLVSYPGNNWDSGNVYSEDAIMDEARQWIVANRTNNFFLYLAPTIPHQSLSVPALAITNFYGDVTWTETPNGQPGYPNGYSPCAQPRRTYAAMISYLDNDIGKLMTCLQTNGLDTNTLIVFTSDNGPVQAGGLDCITFFGSSGPFRGMKGDVYDGGIREPFFVWWPGYVAAGVTNDRTIAFWDIMPTFSDLLGQTFPPDVDGVSFLPTLLNEPVVQPPPSTLYWEYMQSSNEKAVRLGDWKGVRYGDAGVGVPMALYNLSNDVAETTDVSASNPALASQINQVMAARHRLNTNFFRGKDEFPIISPANLALSDVGIGYQLSTNGTVGYVLKPTEQTITTSFQVQVQIQLVSASGYAANGSLIFGNGTNLTNCIRAEVSGDDRKFRLIYAAQSSEMNFVAGDDPFRIMNLDVAYSPMTGVLELIEGTNTPLFLTLTNSPTQVTQYGYYVNRAKTTFSEVLIALDAPSVSPPSLSPVQNGIFSFIYQRPVPSAGVTWRYLSASSLPGKWLYTPPLFEQPRNIFGNLQNVEAQFLFQPDSNAFYRVECSTSP